VVRSGAVAPGAPRTLAKLRAEVAPVDATTWTRFLAGWHGLDAPGRGEGALRAALERLEGAPLSFAELERRILPARVLDFDPEQLDALGARGEWVWLGRGAIGERDLRIALVRRDRVSLLADPPELGSAPSPAAREGAPGALASAVLAHLLARGACFFPELLRVAAGSESALREALWELACAGLVTNDTFGGLRGCWRAASERVRGADACGARSMPTSVAGRPWRRCSATRSRRRDACTRARPRCSTAMAW
jgi:ATP-dependent helicase Lhr and Lhr-like helicase